MSSFVVFFSWVQSGSGEGKEGGGGRVFVQVFVANEMSVYERVLDEFNDRIWDDGTNGPPDAHRAGEVAAAWVSILEVRFWFIEEG